MIAQAAALGNRQEQLDRLTEESITGKPPVDEEEGEGAPRVLQPGGAGGGQGGAAPTNYSINAQAGIITVFANKRQHAAIDRYLRAVRASVLQQVLIEAKIIEITLNDQYRSGVNWGAFLGPNNDAAITTTFNRNVIAGDTGTPTVGVTWQAADGDLSIAAQLVKQFGTVRTLSSPRITVVNNQAAVLKIAQNQIFFDLDVTREENDQSNRTTITVESEIKSVPVGLVMAVQPAIDPVTRRISMALRPSVTRITGFVSDPAVAIQVAQINAESNTGVNVSSQIPIIEVRELDSMVTMESGQTVVMGGMMQEVSENAKEGLPGAMDIPILGQSVSSNIRSTKMSELVIFLRATLVNDRDTVADEDIRLYKTFIPDPRPIAF
jgi:general secretion pathway protein D